MDAFTEELKSAGSDIKNKDSIKSRLNDLA